MKKTLQILVSVFFLLTIFLIISSCNRGADEISDISTTPETPSEADTSSEVTYPDDSSKNEEITEVVTTEEVTTEEVTTEEVTTEEVTTEEVTTEEVTTEEVTTEEVTTEEVTTEEVTTEEVTTEEVTTEEVTTEEVTTEEVTTAPEPHLHTWSAWSVVKQAECSVAGIEERTCGCGEKQNREISALGHVNGRWITVTKETCTSKGLRERICSRCTIILVTESIPMKEHSFGSWYTLNDASCTESGTKQRKCTVCSSSVTEVIPAPGHSEKTVESLKASCVTDGRIDVMCSVCGKVLLSETVKASGHSEGRTVTEIKATCTEDGLNHVICSVCTAVIRSETVKASGHSEGGTVTEIKATCTEDGLNHVICSVCTAVIRSETVKASGHSEGRTVTEIKATCTEDGLNHVICSVCTVILRSETVSAMGHRESDWITAEELSSEYLSVKQKKCLECGIVLEQEESKSAVLIEAERVAAEINAIGSKNTVTFAALSDMHVSVEKAWLYLQSQKSAQFAAKSLSLIDDLVGVDAAIMLGDYSWGSDGYSIERIKKDFKYISECFSNFGDYPVAWLRGNHEINYSANCERPTTNDELYEYVDSNSRGLIVDPNNPKGGYGYFDISEQKVRFIVLNTSDVFGEYVFFEGYKAPTVGISSAQLSWFVGTALDFSDKAHPSEWGIVVFSHKPLNYTTTTSRILLMLEAYKDGKSGTLSYKEEGKSYSVDYDFSSPERAEIICSIHGHSHNFKYEKISSSAKVEPWLWRICIPCVNVGRENSPFYSGGTFAQKWAEYDENGNPVFYYKGTYDSVTGEYYYDENIGTSYCMITIDRDTRTIYAYYVGVGVDRILSY